MIAPLRNPMPIPMPMPMPSDNTATIMFILMCGVCTILMFYFLYEQSKIEGDNDNDDICETFSSGSTECNSEDGCKWDESTYMCSPDTTVTTTDATAITATTSTLCSINQHVKDGVCVSCPSGKFRVAGDNPGTTSSPGSNTECTEKIILPSSNTPALVPKMCDIHEKMTIHSGCAECSEWTNITKQEKNKLKGDGLYVEHNGFSCNKPPCKEGDKSDPTFPGGKGSCNRCLGQETNDGGFLPTDSNFSECLGFSQII